MTFEEEEHIRKWRLILGPKADPGEQLSLDITEQGMDDTLDALYDSEKDRGLGDSSPRVNRWLGDIRKYFPSSMVQVMQKDALDQLGLKEMLMEPELLETIEADVQLVSTLISLNKVLPAKTRDTAKQVVRKVVHQLEQKLRNPLRTAIQGSLNKAARHRRPKWNEVDWPQTIKTNLKHYQADYQTIIPEKLIGYGRRQRQLKHIILLIDQSGSMASSMVYAAVAGSIIASLSAIKTHLIAFDTSVVDLSDQLNDPVDLLFATQLGGGTHIEKALKYARQFIINPKDTTILLISDLMEGGSERGLIKTAGNIKSTGAQLISLLALSDQGTPIYDRSIAAQFSALEIPVFTCTPDLFPTLMAAAINREDIQQWASSKKLGIR